MKRIFVTMAALLMLVGCKETVTEGPALADVNEIASGSISADDLGSIVNDEHNELYGTWTGFAIEVDTTAVYTVEQFGLVESPAEMGAAKISIAIKSFSEGNAEAQALLYGERYVLNGTYKTAGEKLLIRLYNSEEKNKYNNFELVLEGDKLIGTYAATTTETPKRVELKRSAFKYDPKVMLTGTSELVDWSTPKKTEAPKSESKSKKTVRYERPQYRYSSEGLENINASTTKLTEAELKNFTKFDLEILRNTIYARHGFAFKKEFLRQLYNYTDWYVAISDNVDSELTDIEKQNIALLTRMEQYAQDHYSYFGR